MKRFLSAFLITVLVLGCACAEITGNKTSGGVAAQGSDGAVYLALNDGLYVRTGDTVKRIAEGSARCVQVDNGVLYYVIRTLTGGDEYDPEYTDTLYAMNADGTVRQLGESLLCCVKTEYNADWTGYAAATTYPGYGCMTVYNGMIYYIGADNTPGSYTTDATEWLGYSEAVFDTAYETGTCVYRMDPADGSTEVLIPDLGNGNAAMAIDGGRIAVATCLLNGVYPYDFVDFALYDMNGKLVKKYKNSGERLPVYSGDTQFTAIVESIATDGSTVYASLGDSEGDFISSSFIDVSEPGNTLVYELYYTSTILADGKMIYLTSDVQNTFYDELAQYTTTIRVRDGAQENIVAFIPYDCAVIDGRLDYAGGKIYLEDSDKGTVLCVDPEGGMPQILKGDTFVDSPEYLPENYGTTDLTGLRTDDAIDVSGEYLLEDSDTRLYTKEELDIYDTETLGYMRNEILARHGYPFKKEMYKSYFGGLSWYTADKNFSYKSLNEIETANVETIKAIEAERK